MSDWTSSIESAADVFVGKIGEDHLVICFAEIPSTEVEESLMLLNKKQGYGIYKNPSGVIRDDEWAGAVAYVVSLPKLASLTALAKAIEKVLTKHNLKVTAEIPRRNDPWFITDRLKEQSDP